MAVQDVYQLMIERFFALYGPPSQVPEEVPKVLLEYEQAFEHDSRETLVRAVREVIDTNEFRIWPTIGSIKKAISKTRPYRAPVNEPRAPDVVRTPKEEARARELMAEFHANMKKITERQAAVHIAVSEDGKEEEGPKRVPTERVLWLGERRLYERTRDENRAELERLAFARFPPPTKEVAESE